MNWQKAYYWSKVVLTTRASWPVYKHVITFPLKWRSSVSVASLHSWPVKVTSWQSWDQCCWKGSWISCGDKTRGGCWVKAKWAPACWLPSHRNMAHITPCTTRFRVQRAFLLTTSLLRKHAANIFGGGFNPKSLFPCMAKSGHSGLNEGKLFNRLQLTINNCN